MLERLAAWFLNTYVADYVGNVDVDQLSIGLLKGAVELEKLPLKKNALRKLRLPFDIKSGFIGKLKLQIPVRYIKSAPWVVQIDQLYVVLGPAQPHTYSAEEDVQLKQTRKEVKLRKMEEQWRAEQQKSSSWWFLFPTSFTFPSNVLTNLQVIVNDVHIRYEDSEADSAHPFTLGLLLDNLSAQSTDEYWEPKFTSGGDMVRKLMDLQNFSVYFDHQLLGDLEGVKLMEAFLKKRMEVIHQQDPMILSSMLGIYPSIECIVRPVSGQAKLTRNYSQLPLKISDGPRIHLDIQLEEIAIVLCDRQYAQLVMLLKAFQLRMMASKYSKWKSVVCDSRVEKEAERRWKFALNVTLERIQERNVRYSIGFAQKRAHQNVVYVAGYMRHLTEESVPEDVCQMLKDIEREQSYEELLVLRRIVMKRIKKERRLAEAAKKVSSSTPQPGILQGWFPGRLSTGQAMEEAVGSESASSAASGKRVLEGQKLSKDDKLLNELGYDETENMAFRDRIFMSLNFSLVGGSFQLVTMPQTIVLGKSFFGTDPLMEFTFKSLCFSVDLRPRLKYCSFDLSLGSLSVMDHSESNSLFPILVKPRQSKATEEQDVEEFFATDHPTRKLLFAFKVVAEDVDHQRLYQFKVHSRPLDIIYKPSMVSQMESFFLGTLVEKHSTKTRGSRGLDDPIQDHTHSTLRDKLGYMLGGGPKTTSHRITSIKMDISAPCLILPLTFTGEETSVVILDLGHVTFGNIMDWSCDVVDFGAEPVAVEEDDDDEFRTPLSSPPSEQEMGDSRDEGESVSMEPQVLQAALHSITTIKHLQLPYERYLLNLTDLQILIGKFGGEGQCSECPSQHLMESFTLSMKIQRMLKLTSELDSPTLTLAADLSSLRFHVDEEKVHAVLSCLQSVKQSSSNVLFHPPPPRHSISNQILRQGVKEEGEDEVSSVGASMYHSAMESILRTINENIAPPDAEVLHEDESALSSSGSRKKLTSEQLRRSLSDANQRLLVASEKQISAELSINEVLLSLSSRGRVISELNVPGVNLEFLKRPHDLALRLQVQDLLLVDRIQNFGPTYELLVCSGGKSLLCPSPTPLAPSTLTSPSISSFPPSPSLAMPIPEILVSPYYGRSGKDFDSLTGFCFPTMKKGVGMSELLSAGMSGGTFLTLSYEMISPQSPHHSSVRGSMDVGGGGWKEGEEEKGKEQGGEGSGEPIIHRINIQCSAVDAIANQETIMEIIAFFQSALRSCDVLSDLSKQKEQLDLKPFVMRKKEPLHTEVKVTFERLGVRMLRRVEEVQQPVATYKISTGQKPPLSSIESEKGCVSCFFASIMLYGLIAEGIISADISISGKMEGVQVKDVTPKGRNYSNILVIRVDGEEGCGGEDRRGKTERKKLEESTADGFRLSQCLSFSLHRSSRPLVTSNGSSSPSTQVPGIKHDVHFSAFVPAIHYLHSINFVYELELFVKDITSATTSFRNAAVGVAKGLVGQQSKLTKGLSRLHSSFGHVSTKSASRTDSIVDGEGGEEETDTDMPVELRGSRFFFNVSIQSPVIVLPRSLTSEECLVAHLGEIKAWNDYIIGSSPTMESEIEIVTPESPSFTVCGPASMERVAVSVSNISLHATRTRESRRELEASGGDRAKLDDCCKVLKEMSLSLQIDRHLSLRAGGQGEEGVEDKSGSASPFVDSADVVITGVVCDPVLVSLPKEVFNQIMTTLQHGIRKKPRKSSNVSGSCDIATADECKLVTKTVRFHPEVLQKSELPAYMKVPKIFASFSLPKLSLELKHLIDSQDRDLVYVSLDDLSAQFHQYDANYLSLDLTLKSVLIEDLLQPEDSEYRNILTSSSKPLVFPLSPASSTGSVVRNISSSSIVPSSFPRAFFPISHLMSTPKPPIPHYVSQLFSPLRSFNTSSNSNESSSSHDQDETRTAIGQEEKATEADSHTDLLTIKAVYVGKKHRFYTEKFDSISLHADVNFSSVFIVINLQTWVLLLDYLGIGVPTPPSSRQVSPDPREMPPPGFKSGTGETSSGHVQSSKMVDSCNQTNFFIDESLLCDLQDFQSLESNINTTTASSYQNLWFDGVHARDNVGLPGRTGLPSPICTAQEASWPDFTDLEFAQKSSVWGVEGKVSLRCRLNVNSLTVTFNKQEHPLARGSVGSVSAEVCLAQGNVEISGALGQGSVMDMTETGAYYRERFTTTGQKALTFQIFKYGRPDPRMERTFDIHAKVRMASVRYLHTMRFLKEIIAFISHFPQLIDAFQRMKAMAQGNLVYNGPERKARIAFDVRIDGPILLIPKHAFSPDLMVGDIGHLTVSNSFCYDGLNGTISNMRKQKKLEHADTIADTYCDASSSSTVTQGSVYKISPQAASLSGNVSMDTVPSLESTCVTNSTLRPYPTSTMPSRQSLNISTVELGSTLSDLRSQTCDNTTVPFLDLVEEDRRKVEGLLEIFRGPCLLDCIKLSLEEVDVFSAQRVPHHGEKFRIVRQRGNVLKEKGAAKIYIERNLYEDFCRDVPDLHIEGTLQAIHVMLDKPQLELIKGLVEMNLGETIDEFEKPSTVIRDPIGQPMAAEVWTGLLFHMEFVEVQMEFLASRQTEIMGSQTQSLARFDIQESEFTFESRSNQCKTVDLSSNAVIGYDTRYESYAEKNKPSVFEEVLRPRFNFRKDSAKKILQVEIHVFISPSHIKASILLNKLRLMCIFDLILELKNFIFDKMAEDLEDDNDDIDAPPPHVHSPSMAGSLRQQLASRLHLNQPGNSTPRHVSVKLSVTETDFVVLEDMTSLESNAVVLKGTLILTFLSIPGGEKLLDCSIDGLELFSCNLSNEDETALSILDPVSISLEVKPSESSAFSYTEVHGKQPVTRAQIFLIDIQQLNFRLSYNDIKLFLAIAQSLSSLERRRERKGTNVINRAGDEKEVDELLVKKLLPLGYTRADILKEFNLRRGRSEQAIALEKGVGGGGGRVDESERDVKESEKGEDTFSIQLIQVHIGSVSVCLIDDCVDHDVPLLELSLADLQAEHRLADKVRQGKARALFAGEYYNRHISAWEPVLESWKCELTWTMAKHCSTDPDTMTKHCSTDLDRTNTTDRICMVLSSQEQLNINMTSSLIHILYITKASWTKDLQQDRHTLFNLSSSGPSQTDFIHTHQRTASGKVMMDEESDARGDGEDKMASTMERGLALLHSVRFVSTTRRRTKFVPFLLRNNAGLPLKFTTLTSIPSKVYVSPSTLYHKTGSGHRVEELMVGKTSVWMDVSPGSEQAFDFTTRRKIRHMDTRELVVHQLLVKIEGWKTIDIPVSIDKIGVFFREVWPSSDTDLDLVPQLPIRREPIRLVFAISLSDIQKVVNVRSALVLRNTMEIPLEIKLEPNSDHLDLSDYTYSQGKKKSVSMFVSSYVALPILAAKGHLSIPLHLMSWEIYARPQHWGVQYCNKHLPWRHVVVGVSPTSHVRSCDAIGGGEMEGSPPPFRFCVSAQRENYPADVTSSISLSSSFSLPSSSSSSLLSSPSSHHPHPAHTLTLFPPLTITNLLPCDIQFSLVDSSAINRSTSNQLRKLIKCGQDIAVYSVCSQSTVEFDLAMEGFERCQGCLVSANRVGVPQSVVLEDYQGHPLKLSVNIEMIGGGALKVSIFCSFWLINRTGLPLVFKQEGMANEAAGQLTENEKASTTTPLLFSYSEGEFVEKCSMRLGREYQRLGGRPIWCSPFRMIGDSGVCRVFVRSKDDRPDQEYQIGVDIKRGKGQYRQTKIVTFVAHYLLENRTQFKLSYLQRHQLLQEDMLQSLRRVPTVLPGALLPFHWPRTDLDQLLCLRVVDIQDSMWSGGFILDKDSSFHLNIRSTHSYSVFIRCQVTLMGATFHIVFSDAAVYPPPFRLENLSQMPIICCQDGVKSSLAITLNPGQSVPYAWDEHTLPECMCVGVKGGRVLRVELEKFGSKGKVFYESYFYIAASATFLPYGEIDSVPLSSTYQRRTASSRSELVLDVPQGTAVIFQRKNVERRTQLWRMSASRQLVHIASSTDEVNYVLDIAGGCLPGLGQYEPLVLRKCSTLRAQSQTWRFSSDGWLLMDQTPSLCVQSRSGYQALLEGADAVVGRVSPWDGPTPREQEIHRMKHSPGSGILSVSTVPDGPTRILRVVDENRKYSHTSPRDDWVVVENGQVAPSSSTDVDHHSHEDSEEEADIATAMDFEFSLVLEEGVGVSLISAVPEELIYTTLSGLKVEFVSSSGCQSLSANVQYIQVDNKLPASHTPILAYPTPSPSGEPTPSYPVLKLYVERVLYKSPFALVFKIADLRVHDMTVIIEERVLFKLLQWAGVGQSSEQKSEDKGHEVFDLISYRSVIPAGPSTDSLQMYFEKFSIASTELRVSVFTTSQLPEDLQAIKHQLGFSLVKFESPVKLRGFHKSHMLGDSAIYADSLMKHYKKVIKAQAFNILGSVDFLGNPMGLVSDVASGVSGMISSQPDLVGLVRDVTHGMSDTTSKLMGTFSHVLGKATFDTSYQEEREQMLENCRTGGDHLKAGMMGLSSGVFGGMTSMFTQPIQGVHSYGFGGLFTGLAKGVVGTVAKPVAGLFDFASGTSAALRETTSRVSRLHPHPVRLTRCCLGANGALTSFSASQARGQEYLLRLTDGKLSEKLISYELLYEKQQRMRIIISSQFLYFFQQSPPDLSCLDSQISLDELVECKAITAKTSISTVYIELSLSNKQSSYNAPKYKCLDEKTAKKIAQLINYAKNLHEEEKLVVRTFRLQQGKILW